MDKLVLSRFLQVNNYSGWLQMESSGGLRTENDSGQFQMENFSNELWTEVGEQKGGVQI